MVEGAWSRFLEYAVRARTKPTFDFEERQPKLRTAAILKRSAEAGSDGGGWGAPFGGAPRPPALHPLKSARYDLIPPRARWWLNEWARGAPDSLERVLSLFL